MIEFDTDVVRVRMSRHLMETIATRDNDGNRLTLEWGEPDDEGFYRPTITVDYSNNNVRRLQTVVAAARALRDDLQCGHSPSQWDDLNEALLALDLSGTMVGTSEPAE